MQVSSEDEEEVEVKAKEDEVKERKKVKHAHTMMETVAEGEEFLNTHRLVCVVVVGECGTMIARFKLTPETQNRRFTKAKAEAGGNSAKKAEEEGRLNPLNLHVEFGRLSKNDQDAYFRRGHFFLCE